MPLTGRCYCCCVCLEVSEADKEIFVSAVMKKQGEAADRALNISQQQRSKGKTQHEAFDLEYNTCQSNRTSHWSCEQNASLTEGFDLNWDQWRL